MSENKYISSHGFCCQDSFYLFTDHLHALCSRTPVTQNKMYPE